MSSKRRELKQPCEVKGLSAFVQQVAVSTIPKGYRWYVSGWIPEHKDPLQVDEKLRRKYRAYGCESTRWRWKKEGLANVRYYRWGQRFILFVTDKSGESPIWEEEENNLRDVWHQPLYIGNYSISYRNGGRTRAGKVDPKRRSHVQIERMHYENLIAQFEGLATRLSAKELGELLYNLPFDAYKPVSRQFWKILRAVNKKRRLAGIHDYVDKDYVRTFRYSKPVFKESIDSSGKFQGESFLSYSTSQAA